MKKVNFCPNCGKKNIKIIYDKKRSDTFGNGGIMEESYDTIKICTCMDCGNKWTI